jgi:hypothetical protein
VLPLVKLFQYGGRDERKFQVISAAILLYYIYSLFIDLVYFQLDRQCIHSLT